MTTTDSTPHVAEERTIARRRKATADEILEEAVAIFAARGYRGTTIAAIAREVGITDAGVLHHYPTKSALFWAVVGMYQKLQLERFNEMLEPGGLRALDNLGDWGKVLAARPDLLGLQVILSAEALAGDSEMHDYFTNRYRDLHALLMRLMQDAASSGDVRADADFSYEAVAFIGFLDGIRLQWLYDPSFDLARSVRVYVDQLVARLAKPRRRGRAS